MERGEKAKNTHHGLTIATLNDAASVDTSARMRLRNIPRPSLPEGVALVGIKHVEEI